MISAQLPGEGTAVITGISIRRHKSFHPTQATQISFEVATPPKPVFLYGINGAGKSAIGEVLHGLSQRDAQFSHCSLTTSHDQPYRILVYNQAFVDRVIRTADGVPGIFTLGAADAETQEEIEALTAETLALDAQMVALRGALRATQGAGEAVRDTAISGAWEAHTAHAHPPFKDLMRGHHADRKKFFEELDKFEVSADAPLDDLERLGQRLADANSDEAAQRRLAFSTTGIGEIEREGIWGEPIAVSAASRLAPLIEKWGNSDWVGSGRRHLHGEACPFCQQALPHGFAEDLALLLDGDRQAKLDRLAALADRYETRVAQIAAASGTLLAHAFAREEAGLRQAWQLLEAQMRANLLAMRAKLEKPTEPVAIIETDPTPLNAAIDAVNMRIEAFNAVVADRAAEKERIRTMFWQLMRRERAAVYETYKASKQPIADAYERDRAELRRLNERHQANNGRLAALRRQQTGIGASVERINARLTRMGICSYSIAKKEGEGSLYRLARPGQPQGDMTSLSEGEKTIISFFYYLESLSGSSTADGAAVDLGNTIAVIDDPISSLSHNFVFDIASLVHGELIEPGQGVARPRQVIVLTHNLFFLHELIRQTAGPRDLGSVGGKCQLLRVVKSEHSKVVAMVATELMNDYQALWQVLRDARASNASAVMVPNAMRCILEHFFWFTHQAPKFKEALKTISDGDARFTPLARFLDRGSHKDGINITAMDFNQYDLNYYFEKFKLVFEVSGFPEHYAANIGTIDT